MPQVKGNLPPPAPHPGRRLPAHRPVQRSPGVGRQGADRFEQFREDDIAAGEAELEELSGQRKQALEQAEERRNFHQQELERLHSEIQSTELDRECGMLSQEEIEELNRARTEFAGLNAKIEVLSKLVQASPEAAGKQEQDIKQMQASIQQRRSFFPPWPSISQSGWRSTSLSSG